MPTVYKYPMVYTIPMVYMGYTVEYIPWSTCYIPWVKILYTVGGSVCSPRYIKKSVPHGIYKNLFPTVYTVIPWGTHLIPWGTKMIYRGENGIYRRTPHLVFHGIYPTVYKEMEPTVYNMLHTVYTNPRGYITCAKLTYIPWGILYTVGVSSRNGIYHGGHDGIYRGRQIIYRGDKVIIYRVTQTCGVYTVGHYIPWGTCCPRYIASIPTVYTDFYIPWVIYRGEIRIYRGSI